MQKVFIQPRMETYFRYRQLADNNDFSLEILDFSSPQILNNASEYNYRKDFYTYNLRNFCNHITLHGAFIDILVSSPDLGIRRASQNKVRLSIEAAKQIGADSVIFHTGFNPTLRNPKYLTNWITGSSKFWRQMTQEYDIEILLENMWDNNPQILADLMVELSDVNVNICFDVGHHHVFSKYDYKEWFAALGKRITYMHLNDNTGLVDSELPLGAGNIDWKLLQQQLEMLPQKPRVVLEVDGIDNIVMSISYMQYNGIYPWHANSNDMPDNIFSYISKK